MKDIVISIKNLKVKFKTIDNKIIHALNGINLDVYAKETLAIVGESGSGKTQLSLSIMKLFDKNAIVSGEILFEERNILTEPLEKLNKIRGTKISMIFQDPMTSLNPYLKISEQLEEVLLSKNKADIKTATEKSIEMLKLVGISEPERRMNQYPHQFSGGMRQRIMIAMALLTNPVLLIADEPTTALDVTIQAQILDIFEKLKKEMGLAVIMITHDLAVVSNIADKIAVVYAGNIVEYGTRDDIFNFPKHPYTQALLKAIPKLDQNKNERLFLIKGVPPVLTEEPYYCAFKDRCTFAMDKCSDFLPKEVILSQTHKYRCFLGDNNDK